MQLLPYNPMHVNTHGLGSTRFARRYSGHRKNLLPDHNGTTLANEIGIRSERKFRILLSFPPGTEMFHFPGYTPTYVGNCRRQLGFPIRTFPGRRLIGTLPELIAAIPRPSSLLEA